MDQKENTMWLRILNDLLLYYWLCRMLNAHQPARMHQQLARLRRRTQCDCVYLMICWWTIGSAGWWSRVCASGGGWADCESLSVSVKTFALFNIDVQACASSMFCSICSMCEAQEPPSPKWLRLGVDENQTIWCTAGLCECDMLWWAKPPGDGWWQCLLAIVVHKQLKQWSVYMPNS